MKNLIVFPVFGLFFVFSTGAAFIDKETKTAVQELNYKYDRLLQLEHQRHNDLMKALKEIRELASKKPTIRVVAPTPPPAPPVEAPAAVVTAPPVPAPPTEPTAPATPAAPAAVPSGEASLPTTTTPTPAPAVTPPETPPVPASEPAAPTPTAVMEAAPSPPKDAPATGSVFTDDMRHQGAAAAAEAEPEAATPEVTAPPDVPPEAPATASVAQISLPSELTQELSRQAKQSASLSHLALVLSFISLVSIAILIVTVRKSDERLRKMLWKSEVDHLRDEVMGGRPQLKVEKSFDRLVLTNTGSVVADDIKLSLGPAPATMKQRLRVLTRIASGEKAEVEIGPQTLDGQLYGTLEYKNPENGRIYKDQFVLKVDGVTGELNPVQQAS